MDTTISTRQTVTNRASAVNDRRHSSKCLGIAVKTRVCAKIGRDSSCYERVRAVHHYSSDHQQHYNITSNLLHNILQQKPENSYRCKACTN